MKKKKKAEKLSTPNWVQLDVAAWSALIDLGCLIDRQIGLLFKLALAILQSGGRLRRDDDQLKILLRYNGDDWERDIEKVLQTFKQTRGGYLSHNLIDIAIEGAQKKRRQALNAATARWDGQCSGITGEKPEDCEAKVEVELNRIKENLSNSSNPPGFSFSDFLKLYDVLAKKLKIKTQADKATILNAIHWTIRQVKENKRELEVFDELVNWADDAIENKAKNRPAYWITTVKNELHYKPQKTARRQNANT